LLGAMLPRGVGLAPGADALLQEAGWCGVVRAFEARRNEDPLTRGREGGGTDQEAKPPPAQEFWKPDVRHLVVSFLAGVAVTMLVVRQVRAKRAGGKSAVG